MPFWGMPASSSSTSLASTMLPLSPPPLWPLLITISTATTTKSQEGSGAGQLDQALPALCSAGLLLFAQALFTAFLAVATPAHGSVPT